MATILIVEDDNLIAWRLQRQLTGLGHTVLAPVAEAAEGVVAVQAQHPDVVCVDIYGADPWERFAAGRRIEAAGTPVVYLSHASRLRLAWYNRGTVPQFHLAKPFTEETVARTLAWAVQHSRVQRTLRALADRITESHRQATALQAWAKDLRRQAAELRQGTHPRPPWPPCRRSSPGRP